MTVNLHRDRPAPPPLEYDYPPCSVCGETVDLDGDVFYCTPCGAQWPADTAHYTEGGWAEGVDRPRCTSTYRPWPDHPQLTGTVFRCSLDRGHRTRKHQSIEGRSEWQGWPEATPRMVSLDEMVGPGVAR